MFFSINFKKFDYFLSKKDLNASIILAKHLAAKCDRFGINNMNLFKSENYNESKKVFKISLFY